MGVHVLFFGVLAEVTGTGSKYYLGVRSFSDLRLRIEDDFPDIVHYNYRIAVNSEIIVAEPVLKDGDEVALMPPFAGG
jgi:molybdopterin synthase sulfur carrier subunit